MNAFKGKILPCLSSMSFQKENKGGTTNLYNAKFLLFGTCCSLPKMVPAQAFAIRG